MKKKRMSKQQRRLEELYEALGMESSRDGFEKPSEYTNGALPSTRNDNAVTMKKILARFILVAVQGALMGVVLFLVSPDITATQGVIIIAALVVVALLASSTEAIIARTIDKKAEQVAEMAAFKARIKRGIGDKYEIDEPSTPTKPVCEDSLQMQKVNTDLDGFSYRNKKKMSKAEMAAFKARIKRGIGDEYEIDEPSTPAKPVCEDLSAPENEGITDEDLAEMDRLLNADTTVFSEYEETYKSAVADILNEQLDVSIRWDAISKLADKSLLFHIVEDLKDTPILEKIASSYNGKYDDIIREKARQKIVALSDILEAAKKHPDLLVRGMAIGEIKDTAVLSNYLRDGNLFISCSAFLNLYEAGYLDSKTICTFIPELMEGIHNSGESYLDIMVDRHKPLLLRTYIYEKIFNCLSPEEKRSLGFSQEMAEHVGYQTSNQNGIGIQTQITPSSWVRFNGICLYTVFNGSARSAR